MDTKLSYFNFTYPRELVAEKPSKQRDECRMLVVHRDSGEFEHRIFKDFIEFVNPGDVVLANNTKVFPALLYGEKEKTGARITVFLQRELNRDMRLWDVVVDPARKIRIGNKLYFGPNESLVAEVVDNTTSRGRTVRFLFDGTHEEFVKHIRSLGHTPLPDEIQALRIIENIDGSRVWIMLNSQRDANASIAVVMSSADADMIDTFGAYGKTGTTLRVRGYFFVACPEHAGGFDVHAASVDVLAPGSSNPDEFDINAFIPGAIFLGVGILLLALFIYIRERLR